MGKKNKILLALYLIVFLAINFLRDYFFKNVNSILGHKLLNTTRHYARSEFNGLENLNYQELYLFKWVGLLLFSVLFFAFTYFILKTIYPDYKKSILKTTTITYIGLGMVIAVCIGFYYVPSISQASYLIARRLLGVLHSPIPLMLLFLIYLVQKKLSSKA